MPEKKLGAWAAAALVVVAIASAGFFYISRGGAAAVPDVVGVTKADGVHAIQSAGLKLGFTRQTTDTAQDSGTIVSQMPPAGTNAEKGSTVDVVIALGGIKTEVPDLVGDEQEAASAALGSYSLMPVVYAEFSTSTPAGVVFVQTPPAGSFVAPKGVVALGISRGPAPKAPHVPNVVGAPQGDAKNAIDSAGFVATAFEQYSSQVAEGLVVAQSPSAGEAAPPDSEVAFVVSKGRPPAAASVGVPDLAGMTEAQATSALRDSGLGVSAHRIFSDGTPSGAVASQFPKAREQVARGSLVVVALSSGKAPARANVPSLVGIKASAAIAALTAAGLRGIVVPDATSMGRSGVVTTQYPAPGSSVPPASKVVIIVAGTTVQPVLN